MPISDDAKTALMVQLQTGLRIGEILAIQWGDVDFRGRTIRHTEQQMKSGKAAQTIMSDATRRILLTFKRDTQERGTNRVFRDGLDTSYMLGEMRQLGGWLQFTAHDLRRSVRTYLQDLGCPMEIRARITNHTTPAGVARHYDHAQQEQEQLQWL